MFLSENGERITVGPATNGFGRRLATAVIYDDDLKSGSFPWAIDWRHPSSIAQSL